MVLPKDWVNISGVRRLQGLEFEGSVGIIYLQKFLVLHSYIAL